MTAEHVHMPRRFSSRCAVCGARMSGRRARVLTSVHRTNILGRLGVYRLLTWIERQERQGR